MLKWGNVNVFCDVFLDEKLFSVIKLINEISSEGSESIWSKCLPRLRSKLIIAFLVGVTTFFAFLKKPVELSNGGSDAIFYTSELLDKYVHIMTVL